MGDPEQPEHHTIQLSAALAGGAEARGRQLALLEAVVATFDAVTDVRPDGDALRVAFADAHAAALCAIELQQRIEADNRTAAVPGVLRIAAALEPGRDDRLCALAGAGQILVDAPLWERLRPHDDLDLEKPRRLGGPDAAAEIRWEPLPEPVVPLPVRLEVARPEHFVGRAEERRRLEPLVARAAHGGRQVILLGGEPGIGKSRLARELAVAAHARGSTVLQGRCDEDLRMPYQPFVEALSHLVDHAADAVLERHVEEHGGELCRLVPALGRRRPDAPAPRGVDNDTERYLLFSAVAGLLGAEQAQRPVVLFLDDVQWADTPTLLLLRHLVASDLRLRLTIIATFRSTELDDDHPLAKLLADLHREPDVARVDLTGLDAGEVAELARETTGHALDAAGLDAARTLQRRTSGNAFFVTEMLRHHGDDLATAQMPGSVRDVLERRLARLGDAVRDPLAAAAIVGQEFDLELVGQMVDGGPDAVAEAVDAASEAALIIPPRRPGDRYAFAHALIVTALYEGLGPARRARLHRRAAEALEAMLTDGDGAPAQPGSRVGELARHWLNAEPADLERALRYTQRAGEHAVGQLAPDDAVDWYRQGLDLFDQVTGADDEVRFELLVGLGDAQRQSGDPEFRTTLLEAASLARRRKDGPGLIRAVLANSRGFVSASGVVDDERLHALEEALEAVGEPDSPERAVLLATLAAELAFSPADRPRRVALSDEALALARRLDDPAALSRVLSLRFVTLWMPETLQERLANSDENVSAARRTGDPVAEFHAVHWRAAALVEAGRLTDAWRDVEHEAALAERLGQPTMRWLATYDQGNLEIIAGSLAEAEHHAHEALQIATLSAQPDALSFFTSQLTNIRYEQGRLAELQPLIAQVVAENPGIPAFRAVLAMACCEGDLDDEARRLLGHETSTNFSELPPDVTWLPGLAIYAEVAAHLQDRAAAEVLYALLEPWAGQVVYSGISAWGCVDHHLGATASVIGRYAEAEEHLRRAAELNAELRAPIWVARTELATARLLLLRDGPGDRERGRALLERAAAAAQRLGSATLARRAAGLLGYEKALSALPIPVMPNPGARAARTPPPTGAGGAEAVPPEPAAPAAPSATFRLEGEFWTVTGTETVRLKNRKGLQYLATLLERPDVEVHSIDLVGGPVDAAARGRSAGGQDVALGAAGGDAGELLDAAAKAAYRERLEELREDLEEAERFHDVERAARLREELEFIGQELARAVGLGGRDRKAGSAAERARVNVTRAIRGAVKAIAEHDARLGHHLERSIRTGVFCAYEPGPSGPDSWRVTVER
ncbi:MAG TPA: AAA family ATPase [Baekduia sp.]|uniref:ATP-binding protein n=1 Tax=Baekduia sp. TaxID=2600305 RepID=UPI002D79A263|nr:AAA family ATPase [Baekduia sp.]HET6509651.1 AAA family ATPase [Baekduia sp.]